MAQPKYLRRKTARSGNPRAAAKTKAKAKRARTQAGASFTFGGNLAGKSYPDAGEGSAAAPPQKVKTIPQPGEPLASPKEAQQPNTDYQMGFPQQPQIEKTQAILKPEQQPTQTNGRLIRTPSKVA